MLLRFETRATGIEKWGQISSLLILLKFKGGVGENVWLNFTSLEQDQTSHIDYFRRGVARPSGCQKYDLT